jgi:hypothetical protein
VANGTRHCILSHPDRLLQLSYELELELELDRT